MTDHIYKHPRLYLNAPFEQNGVIPLEQGQAHYLRNVLRKGSGEQLRVFNGKDGEWLARIDTIGKKGGDIILDDCTRPQAKPSAARHLYFSPIKKERMAFLIEKSVELGVTDLQPVLMSRSVMRKVNEERTRAHIIEAAEQSERLDIPVLYPLQTLSEVMAGRNVDVPLYACLERNDQTKPISFYPMKEDAAFLVGPEGGFDNDEMARILTHENVKPIGLGDAILRAETASVACLSYAAFISLCET